MDGFLNVLKPPGMTSHDVVYRIRRLAGAKAGHGGTLDPGAAGVLPVAVGKATRLTEFLLDKEKAYRAEVTLGISTDTADGFGTVTGRRPAAVGESALASAAAALVGEHLQVPPMTSAVSVGGVRLHRLARRGLSVQRQPRRAVVSGCRLLRSMPAGSCQRVLLDITCSKGTYVRLLCEAFGEHLGLPAHMSFLIRTAAGPFHLAGASTLEELALDPESCLLPMDWPLRHLPALVVGPHEAEAVSHGLPFTPAEAPGEGAVRVLDEGGRLLAVATISPQGKLRYDKVLSEGGAP